MDAGEESPQVRGSAMAPQDVTSSMTTPQVAFCSGSPTIQPKELCANTKCSLRLFHLDMRDSGGVRAIPEPCLPTVSQKLLEGTLRSFPGQIKIFTGLKKIPTGDFNSEEEFQNCGFHFPSQVLSCFALSKFLIKPHVQKTPQLSAGCKQHEQRSDSHYLPLALSAL